MSDYLKELFIDEAKPALERHSGGSGGGGDTDGQLDALIDGSITEVSSNVTSVSDYAFYDCDSLTTVNLPLVTSIGSNAFQNCSSLTTADFPLVTYVGQKAFYDCDSLTTVNFPLATDISSQPFYNCDNLTTVELSAVEMFRSNVFMNCKKLESLILRNTNITTLSNTNSFPNTPIASGTGYIYVPRALVDSYKSATNWSTYATQFRALEDYTVDGTIYGEVDPNKPQLTKYTIRFLDGDTVLQESQVAYGEMPVYAGEEPTKEDYAFDGWTPEIVAVTGDADYTVEWVRTGSQTRKLIDRTITSAESDTVTSIDNYAFKNCSNLTTANFPLVTSIGTQAFISCSNLTTVNFPAVTSIGAEAFSNCFKITTVILRSETMCVLLATTAFKNCYHILGTKNSTYNPTGAKDGFIYVPAALIDSYKAATNWSTYATRFRAIEDYPEICGGV